MAGVLTQQEVLAKLTPALFEHGAMHKKFGKVFLKKATAGEVVETIINGKVETSNTVPGEGTFWISRADTTAQEKLVLPDAKRRKLYSLEPAGGACNQADEEGFAGPYFPLGRVLALQITSGMIDQFFPDGKFVASWGSEMAVAEKDFLVAPAPPGDTGMPETLTEIYRIEQSMFVQTYGLE